MAQDSGVDPWARLYRLAGRQHGAVSTAQAVACGISESTWWRRIRREGWPRPFRGVALVPGGPPTLAQSVMAAVLAVNGPVWAARGTAAALLGLADSPPSRITLVAPPGVGSHPPRGVHIVRTQSLVPAHTTLVGPVPVTTPARTVIDWAAELRTAALLRPVVIQAVQRRRLRLDQVGALLEALGPVAGAGTLRTVLRQLDEERCDSELEYLVRRKLRAAGFRPAPGPVPVTVAGGRVFHVDIGFPPRPVGIEVDGRAYHLAAADVAADHGRANLIMAVRYRLLRVTWLRVDRDWDGFCEELRLNLAATAATLHA